MRRDLEKPNGGRLTSKGIANFTKRLPSYRGIAPNRVVTVESMILNCTKKKFCQQFYSDTHLGHLCWS